VSLNRKRRIFRSSNRARPRMHLSSPSAGVWLAALGGVASTALVVWLFVGANAAPAAGPNGMSGGVSGGAQIGAPASELAVVTGDTLLVGQQAVRLSGISAPAHGTLCGAVDCGVAAANALANIVQGHAVDCTLSGHDHHGRPFGICQVQGMNLNTTLVRKGWAYATDAALRPAEDGARQARLGVWGEARTPSL